jgi:hypothetical protein
MGTQSNGLVYFAFDNDYLPELETLLMGWVAPPDPPPPRRPAFG